MFKTLADVLRVNCLSYLTCSGVQRRAIYVRATYVRATYILRTFYVLTWLYLAIHSHCPSVCDHHPLASTRKTLVKHSADIRRRPVVFHASDLSDLQVPTSASCKPHVCLAMDVRRAFYRCLASNL